MAGNEVPPSLPNGGTKVNPTLLFTPTCPKTVDFSQQRESKGLVKFRSFHDFYLMQSKRHYSEFLTAQRLRHKGQHGRRDCQIRFTPNDTGLSAEDEEESTTIPEAYRMYDETELSVILKGHVKRLCEYFQNAVPNKQYTDAIKAIIAKNKARRAAESPRSDGSARSTASVRRQIRSTLSTLRKVEPAKPPPVGLLELAQHMSGARLNCKAPVNHQEALKFLQKEGVSYNNAMMFMGSAKESVPSKQVFNWKTAMKAMCTNADMPDTPDLSLLDKDGVVRIDLPLPLEPSMREFLRKRGFVIDEEGMPVTDGGDTTEYDGVQFFMVPPSAPPVVENKPVQEFDLCHREFQVDLKTGPVLPDVPQDPSTLMVYDLQVNKVNTDADLAADADGDDDEFEPETHEGKRGDFFEGRQDNLDDFANDLFSRADPQNFYQIIDDMRKLMPEECAGRQGDSREISTGRREKNSANFGWFLNNAEVFQCDLADQRDTELHDENEVPPEFRSSTASQFNWLKGVKRAK